MRSIKEALKEVQLKDLWLEFGFLAFMALYLANMYRGAQINKRMAYAWAKEFATEGSILDRNFSHVGICAQLPILLFIPHPRLIWFAWLCVALNNISTATCHA